MSHKLFLAAALSSVFFFSCGGEKKEDKKDNNQKDTTQTAVTPAAEVNPNTVADLGITGMVCEMNCVGMVKRTVLAMTGVSSWEMQFNPDEDMNHAVVRFDKQVVNEKQMVEAIEKLNDGQYKVKSVEVREMTEEEIKTEKTTTKKKNNVVVGEPVSSYSGGSLSMPNIFDVFGNTL